MSRSRADRLFAAIVGTAALVAGAIVVLIIVFLLRESLPALRDVGVDRFLGDPGWSPDRDPARGTFRLLPMLAGTALLTAGALALAVPAGILSALFSTFYAPPALARGYRQLVAVMAGVPSVVYGFWALVTLVPLLRRLAPPGQSLLAGVLVLALMVLPTVVLLTESALRAVPRSLLDGATALGLGRRATALGVALPAAKAGIVTGVSLATARAIGETMAVLMVCGNVVQLPSSVFDPVRSLTANIALEMAYATGAHRSSLFVSGLVLMTTVAALLWVSGLWTSGSFARRLGRG